MQGINNHTNIRNFLTSAGATHALKVLDLERFLACIVSQRSNDCVDHARAHIRRQVPEEQQHRLHTTSVVLTILPEAVCKSFGTALGKTAQRLADAVDYNCYTATLGPNNV